MREKLVWLLGGALALSAILLLVSCAGLVEEPAPALPATTISPPVVPHTLEGRSDCLLCHEKGIGGAPRFPASHIGRPSDVCTTCHIRAPAANGAVTTPPPVHPPATTPPAAPPAAGDGGKAVYDRQCAACHGPNRQGIAGFAPPLTAESLAGRSDAEIRDAISNGRPNTAMPPFKVTLSEEEIDALIEFIKSPVP